MPEVVALPQRGEVFLDARGDDRALRVSWHSEQGVVVLSLWRGALCSCSFRLPIADAPALIAALVDGLAAGYLPAGRADAC